MDDPVFPYTRLFIALFPGEQARRSLAQFARILADQCGGRPLPAENLHITLRYIGKVDQARLDCLQRLLPDLEAEMFRLRFDRFEYRARQRMIWALPGDHPQALGRLVVDLEDGLSACGLDPPDHVFFPHITLVRNVSRKPVLSALDLDLETGFESIDLVSSETLPGGSRYTVVDKAVFRRP